MKLNPRSKKIGLIILTVLLLFVIIHPGYAKEQTDSGKTDPFVFPKVQLHANSYIQLHEILMLPSIDGNIVSMTVEWFNGESRDLTFIDYWLNLKTKSGSVFSVNLLGEEDQIHRISPHTRQMFTFYAKVPENIRLQDLIVEFIAWDFSMPNYERVLGTISVPDHYNPVTPANQKKSLFVESTKLDTQVEQFRLQSVQSKIQATVTFSIRNTGSRSITMPDYKYYIRTDQGDLYGLTMSKDQSETMIQPKDTVQIHLQGMLPSSVSSDSWELVVTLQSNEEGGMERAVAFYQLMEQVVEEKVVPAEESATLDINDIPVRTWIEEVVKYKRDDRWRIELTLSFENEGTETVDIPQYQYTIRTSEGYRYPMSGESEELSIQPKIAENMRLTASIPTSVSEEGWQLIIEEKEEDGELLFPLAVYEVPEMKERESEGLPLGQKYSFENSDGKYAIELVAMQRLPWNQEDILSAEIQIYNEDEKSLPIPKLSGTFELDGVSIAKEQTNVVQLDQTLALRPQEKTKLILYSKIPYTYQFDRVSLFLEEERGQDTDDPYEVALVDFSARWQQLILPVIMEGEPFKIETIGKRAAIGIRSTQIYADSHSRLYYMEMEVENEEKRQNHLPHIAAFLKTIDGSYFPVTIQDIEERVITPSGKALLAAHAVLPFGVSASDVKLVVGEMIENEAESAFVAGAEMDLPPETSRSTESMEDIEIYPYNISFSRFKLFLTSGSATLSFHYELEKSRQYQILPEGHKLVMELVDNETPYEQTFEFETDLKIGNHTGQMTANINIGDVAEKLSEGTDFWVRVYDEYEGYRKLLANQRVLLIESQSGQ